MGMFKWLKREFGGEARERRRNSQNISSSSIASESNHDIQRDDEYLRKLSKFNEWRSSQLSIKRSPDEGNSPVGILSRRKSQADLVFPTSGRTVDTRLSLGNNFRSIENPFFDDKVQERSIDVAVQARNNLSLTEVNSSRNISTPGKIRLRKTPSKHNSQEGSLNSPNLANGHRSLTENDWTPNQNLVGEYKDFGYLSPPDNFYHNNSMPFMDTSPKSDEGYQRVINKHGDIVEYALPFCENSGDALSNSKRLPDIEERSAENSDVVEQNSESDGSSANIGGRRNSMPVNSKIYQKNKTKSHRKISDVEVKFIKNNNVTKTPRPAANDRSCNGESGNHNREFLEAIEDLVSLGKWSRRQLESTDPVLPPRNKKTVLSDKEVLKQISTVTPTSYTARVIVPHNSLCQTGNSLRGYAHSPLEWTSATWQGQDVSVRSRRRLPIGDLPQARAGMKRDVQVLSYVCHPNIALLMAVAQIDDLEISSVVEPFPATLHQILHHKPQPYPLPLETSLQYLQQLCGALSFLHNRGYIHTNVSSHCILITHSLATAKLSGFELAVRVDKKYHEYRDSPRKRYGGDTVLHIEELFHLNQRRKSSGREHSSRCKDSVPASEEECSKPRAKSVRRKKDNKTEYFTSVASDKSRNNNFSDVCVWGEPQPVSDRAILAHYNWQAPELFCEVDSKVRSCTASDAFSLCVVLWECCTGSIPWYYSSSTEISDKYRAFTSLPKPKSLLPCFVDILTKGLEISPTQRTISLVEITKLLKDAEEQVINITTENDFIKIINQSKTNKPAIPVSTNTSILKDYTNETRREETYQQKAVKVNEEPVNQIQEPVSHTKDVVYTGNGINCSDFTNDDIKRMTAVDLIADIEERNNINNMFKPGYDMSHTSKEVSSEKFCVLEISTGKDNLCLDLNIDAITSDDFPDTPSTCFAQTPVALTGVKDFTNSTEYFSMSDNKIMNVTEVSRNDGDKPVASNTPNAAFVYNFTPKSYTSLSITTPMSLSIPLDVGSSNFGSSKTSKSYSFNIENYELPSTPIARNTKIRKNTWLSESKLNWNTDIGMNKKSFSLSSNGIHDKGKPENRGLQSRSMVENSKDRNFFHRLSKPEKRFESPRSVKGPTCDASDEGDVKVQINKMFSRQLNSTISFVGNETSTKVNALSVSMPTQSCRYKHTNRRSVSPAVKPASHNTSAGCVSSHPRNENTRQFVCSPSSPYRVDAIKPASHQDELNSSSSDVIRAENYTKVPIDVKKAVTKKKILNMDTASFFESSLWQIEKRKCINRMLPEDPFSSSTPNKSTVILKTAATVENEPRTMQAVAETAHRHVQTDFVTQNIIQSEDAVLKDHDISKIDTVTTSFTDFENIPGVQMKKVRSYDCKTLPTPKCKTLRARRRTLRSLQLSSDNSTFDGICELNNNGSKCGNERLLNVLNNSLIYNTALDQSEETYWKGPIATQCSYCGSHLINGSVYKSQTLQTITLSPEISGLCEADGGSMCAGSDSLFNVSDDTLSLPGSIELPVTLTLKRYQAIPALQKVRSTEDLYFDDDFSQEQLGSHMQLSGSRGDLYYQHTDMTDLGELGFKSVVTEVDGYEVVFDIFKPVNVEVDNKVEALNIENEIDKEQNENEIDREQMNQNVNKNRNGNPTNAENEKDDCNVERNLNEERNMEPTDVDDLPYGEQLKQNMYLTGAENEIDEKQNMEKDRNGNPTNVENEIDKEQMKQNMNKNRNGNTTNTENEIKEQMKHNMLIYGIYENVKQNIEEKPNDELATDL